MKTPIGSISMRGAGRKRRRFTGMQASKSVNFSGRRQDSAEAMMTRMVAVTVVLLVRQADRKSFVVGAGMFKEWKFDVRGREIGVPDQMFGRLGTAAEVERRNGWRSSRFGVRGTIEVGIVVFRRGGGLERRAERKCL